MAKTTLESVQAFEQIIGASNQQQIGFEQVSQGMKDILPGGRPDGRGHVAAGKGGSQPQRPQPGTETSRGEIPDLNDIQEQLLRRLSGRAQGTPGRDPRHPGRDGTAGGGPVPGADLEEAFRRAHSLKAAARVCDLAPVDDLGQRLETLSFQDPASGILPSGQGSHRGDPHSSWTRSKTGPSAWRKSDRFRTSTAALAGPGRRRSGPPQRQPPRSAAPADGRQLGGDELSQQLLAAFQIEHKEHLEGIRAILAEIEKGGTDSAGKRGRGFPPRPQPQGGRPAGGTAPGGDRCPPAGNAVCPSARRGPAPGPEVLRAIHLGLDAIEDGAACLAAKAASSGTHRVPWRPSTGSWTASQSRRPDRRRGQLRRARCPSEASRRNRPRCFQAAETVRVSADNLDRLLRSTGQLLTESLRQNLVARELGRPEPPDLKDMEKEWESVRGVAAAALRHLAETPALARVARYSEPGRAPGAVPVPAGPGGPPVAAAQLLDAAPAGRTTPARRPPGAHGVRRKRLPGLPQDDARPGAGRGQGNRLPGERFRDPGRPDGAAGPEGSR